MEVASRRGLLTDTPELSSRLPSYTSIAAVGAMMFMLIALVYILLKCVALINSRRLNARIKSAMLKRRNTNDKFRKLNGYSWDCVMAFRVLDDEEAITMDQRTWNLRRILAQLASGGLQIRLFYSTMHNVVYCKIRASQMRLMKEAARIGLRLQLDEQRLSAYCRAGKPELGWGPIMIPDKSDVTSIAPFKHISCPYHMNEADTATHPVLKTLYRRWPVQQLAKVDDKDGTLSPLNTPDDETADNTYHTEVDGDICELAEQPDGTSIPTDADGFGIIRHESLLRGADRLKLIDSIINNGAAGGCHINTNVLLKTGCILAYAPLHDHVALSELQFKWVVLLEAPWNQVTEQVKDYFGERVGLYFAWLGLYTSWLMVASVAGVVAWAFVQADDNNPNAAIMPYFAGFMAIWATMFLESWKRKENRLAMEWCMDGFTKDEQNRPEFSGLKARSPITGQETVYFPEHLRFRRVMKSNFIVFMSLSVVIASVALIMLLRVALHTNPVTTVWSSELSSLLVAVQIELLSAMFNKLAVVLTDNENHMTDSMYEDALISKSFAFQFLNSFACLFYVSFVKPFSLGDRCQPVYCFYELQGTLGTIFMSRMFIHNYFKMVKPLLDTRAKLKETQLIDRNSVTGKQVHEISEVEQMFLLPEFHSLMGTFEDYSGMVAQFGYMTMFIAAFPLCTVLALTNNYIQMRVDAWRLCQVVQRPEPKSAETIGSWQRVMDIIGLISVFTNAGLVSFTGSFAVSYSWAMRVWIFFLMSSFIILVKWAIMALIPDVPYEVKVQEQRMEYVTDKVVHNRPDKLDTVDASSLRVRPNFRMSLRDTDPL